MRIFAWGEDNGDGTLLDVCSIYHFLVGFIGYFVFAKWMPLTNAFVLMMMGATVFEIIENSHPAIHFFNRVRLSMCGTPFEYPEYNGDSAINSSMDILVTIAGFWLGYAIWRPQKGCSEDYETDDDRRERREREKRRKERKENERARGKEKRV
jgi:hypothetical protein